MEHEVQLCSCLIGKVREERRTEGAPRVARARGAPYTVVTRWLHGGYAVVTRWLHGGYTVVTRWLHGGYAVVTRWLRGGYAVVQLQY
jgi:hypothetical protein